MTAKTKTAGAVKPTEQYSAGPLPVKAAGPPPPSKRPTAKELAEDGVHSLVVSDLTRAIARKTAPGDPTGARWQHRDADDLAQKAKDRLELPAEYIEVGEGGELVPVAPGDLTHRGHYFRDTVRDKPDMTAAHASYQRMTLAQDARALGAGIDMANTIRARNSVEKCIAHQLAALHAAGMDALGTAAKFAGRVRDHWENPAIRAAANVETARSMNAATRCFAAFNEAAMAIKKLRARNGQTVKVIHQHIDNRGGQAVVAGDSMGGRGKRRGRK